MSVLELCTYCHQCDAVMVWFAVLTILYVCYRTMQRQPSMRCWHGLVQERRNSSALALELRLPCTNQSIGSVLCNTAVWHCSAMPFWPLCVLLQNYAQTAINEMLGWYGLQDYGSDAADAHRPLPPTGGQLPALKPGGATSNGKGDSGTINGWESCINGPKSENHKSEGQNEMKLPLRNKIYQFSLKFKSL